MKRIVLCLCLLVASTGLLYADPRRGLSVNHGWPKSGEAIAFVVHGINPDHKQLDALIENLSSRGFRVMRFVYDDHDDLDRAAMDLSTAIKDTARAVKPPRIAVVAHSMGGLVSRRALTKRYGVAEAKVPVRLLTIASPFGGFTSANWARFDFGLGPKAYDDLGTRAKFITKPGTLSPNVTHVKLETLEKDKRLGGADDDTVPLKSQRQKTVDAGTTLTRSLNLGHVGSIHDERGAVPLVTRIALARYVAKTRGPLPAGRATPLVAPKPAATVKASAKPAKTKTKPASHRNRRGITHRLRSRR
jgi:pimeloyl-ACP methyl ester carboxylesterase